jgi:hypothetical protein
VRVYLKEKDGRRVTERREREKTYIVATLKRAFAKRSGHNSKTLLVCMNIIELFSSRGILSSIVTLLHAPITNNLTQYLKSDQLEGDKKRN